MGIGANIKQLLKSQNKTIKWLSHDTGISVNTLYNITKRDDINVLPNNIQAIARSLNVLPQELTGKTIEPSCCTEETLHEPGIATLSASDSLSSSKGTQKVCLRDVLEEINVRDFKKTINQMENRLEGAKNSTAFHPKIIEHIIQRKEDEIELLKLFFLLAPYRRKRVLASLKQELIFQEMAKLDEDFNDIDIPDEWLDDSNSPQFERAPEEWAEEFDMTTQENEIEEKIEEKINQLEI